MNGFTLHIPTGGISYSYSVTIRIQKVVVSYVVCTDTFALGLSCLSSLHHLCGLHTILRFCVNNAIILCGKMKLVRMPIRARIHGYSFWHTFNLQSSSSRCIVYTYFMWPVYQISTKCPYTTLSTWFPFVEVCLPHQKGFCSRLFRLRFTQFSFLLL